MDQDEISYWAAELSKVTPQILTAVGDGESAFYRNILDEPDFPFESIVGEGSKIGNAIMKHFDVANLNEIRLDDAFCVHYNTEQDDTSGARHMDPSDITVNMCLENMEETEGSQVMFHGTKQLKNDTTTTTARKNDEDDQDENFRFMVPQEAGFATIHWGSHSHETLPLHRGRRTNVILTYCFKDPARSDVSMRTCY